MSLDLANGLQNVSFIEMIIKGAEKRLSGPIEKKVTLLQIDRLTEELFNELYSLANVFRPELRRSKEEYLAKFERFENPMMLAGFIQAKPIALVTGYEDPVFSHLSDKPVYYGDVLAVSREYQGKGIGPVLQMLGVIAAYEKGYRSIVMQCETTSYQGKNLPDFYRKLGFRSLESGYMIKNITPLDVFLLKSYFLLSNFQKQ